MSSRLGPPGLPCLLTDCFQNNLRHSELHQPRGSQQRGPQLPGRRLGAGLRHVRPAGGPAALRDEHPEGDLLQDSGQRLLRPREFVPLGRQSHPSFTPPKSAPQTCSVRHHCGVFLLLRLQPTESPANILLRAASLLSLRDLQSHLLSTHSQSSRPTTATTTTTTTTTTTLSLKQ